MDVAAELKGFAKDSVRLVKRCTKPDAKGKRAFFHPRARVAPVFWPGDPASARSLPLTRGRLDCHARVAAGGRAPRARCVLFFWAGEAARFDSMRASRRRARFFSLTALLPPLPKIRVQQDRHQDRPRLCGHGLHRLLRQADLHCESDWGASRVGLQSRAPSWPPRAEGGSPAAHAFAAREFGCRRRRNFSEHQPLTLHTPHSLHTHSPSTRSSSAAPWPRTEHAEFTRRRASLASLLPRLAGSETSVFFSLPNLCCPPHFLQPKPNTSAAT